MVHKNPDKKGNIRDYTSINELLCLSNMENINAVVMHIVFCIYEFHISINGKVFI